MNEIKQVLTDLNILSFKSNTRIFFNIWNFGKKEGYIIIENKEKGEPNKETYTLNLWDKQSEKSNIIVNFENYTEGVLNKDDLKKYLMYAFKNKEDEKNKAEA